MPLLVCCPIEHKLLARILTPTPTPIATQMTVISSVQFLFSVFEIVGRDDGRAATINYVLLLACYLVYILSLFMCVFNDYNASCIISFYCCCCVNILMIVISNY